MLELRSTRAFRKEPLGGCVAGKCWLYFAFADGPHGYALLGNPPVDDITELMALLELELDRMPPHPGMVDLLSLEAAQPELFEQLASYSLKNRDRLGQIVTETAMVRPDGLMGAVAEGFFRVVAPPFPVTYFSDLALALRHLGHPAPDRARDALVALKSRISGVAPAVVALEAYLETHLLDPSIEAAASAARVSVRTMQRRLEESGTSFGAEITRARVRAAERLLATTPASLSSIAIATGFASPQHFSDAFKRQTGETPSGYRARSKGTDAPPLRKRTSKS